MRRGTAANALDATHDGRPLANIAATRRVGVCAPDASAPVRPESPRACPSRNAPSPAGWPAPSPSSHPDPSPSRSPFAARGGFRGGGNPPGAPSARSAPHTKASRTGPLLGFEALRQPVWAPRDYAAFAREGFAQNAIVYRAVRMVAEAAASRAAAPLRGRRRDHRPPAARPDRPPQPRLRAPDLLESWYGFLLVSGNAYLEAVALGGEVRELFALRPDRMKVIPGPDGWPEAFEYTAGGRSVRFAGEVVPGVRPILHVKLFNPVNDHYGLSPIEAAATAIDIHNTASQAGTRRSSTTPPAPPARWSTPPATATSPPTSSTASRPSWSKASRAPPTPAARCCLEGGLDWKSMSLTPKDMDFIEAKHVAAREIALALGVPPMLLGIPGDNTYSNYQEATRSLWRQTVLPLATRTAKALSTWLSPAYGTPLELAARPTTPSKP